jgi:hypothetical protein
MRVQVSFSSLTKDASSPSDLRHGSPSLYSRNVLFTIVSTYMLLRLEA